MKINGTGCSLVDNLYTPVDFNSEGYYKWTAAGGTKDGIITGGLVFGDDLEATSNTDYRQILNEITGGSLTPVRNIGGPAIVAVIHLSQILRTSEHEVGFIGSRGDDEDGRFLADKLSLFNINTSGYLTTGGHTPFTDVLADPSYDNGAGERSFINYIGAAGEMRSVDLPEAFFDADMLIFGGTALTPGLHDQLSAILKKGRNSGCINCINTVYDFRSQKKNPNGNWPLVNADDDFVLIDLLIADNEEAIRISGKKTKQEAADFFMSKGVKSVIITHGAEDLICRSNGTFFSETESFSIPVCRAAGEAIKKADAGTADTTGCGDNFAGGIYASIVQQLSSRPQQKPSLKKAAAFGAVSGGFAGLYLGGVYYERTAGEKLVKMQPFLTAYREQTGIEYE